MDDVFLRDMLAIDSEVSQQPGIEHLREAFRRSAKQGKSIVARIVDTQGVMARDAMSGLFLPHLRTVSFERTRVNRILTWFARGLYYHLHKQVLPATYRYGCAPVSKAEAEKRAAVISGLGIEPRWEICRGEFKYAHLWFEDPFVTFWQMILYDTVYYEVSSIPPDCDSIQSFNVPV